MTLVRRLAGLALIAGGVAIYLAEAARGTFACERATRTCVHTVERVGRPTTTRTFPLADVLGASYKWSYWEEAPGAREILARARSMADVTPAALYANRSTSRGSTSSSSPVVFTRQGLVPLLPGFPPGNGGPLSDLEGFVAGDGGGRIELVQDARLSGLPLAVILGLVGAVLVLLRGPRAAPVAPSPSRHARVVERIPAPGRASSGAWPAARRRPATASRSSEGATPRRPAQHYRPLPASRDGRRPRPESQNSGSGLPPRGARGSTG